VLREARLAALDDSPHAFMSRYEHECRWGEVEWKLLFRWSTWVLAREEHTVIGLTRSTAEDAPPRARYLESIWVAPTHRRHGVFRALLARLTRVERHAGVTDLLLWVMEDNHVARRAYAALGFQPTGERQILPALGRFEQQLLLDIRATIALDPAAPP
jgi:ribosomal protein S18 acetylase RimI-like enzyme